MMILISMHVNKTIAKVCPLLFKELYQILQGVDWKNNKTIHVVK